MDNIQDKIRGCLIGGAAGDALGSPVEFLREREIFEIHDDIGITEYSIAKHCNKALISDDTQMTLFTANGLLVGDTRGCMRGIQGYPRHYVKMAYSDWLYTQNNDYQKSANENRVSWLCDVPELYNTRAPGNTCLTALENQGIGSYVKDYIEFKQNRSKGCGGVMRVAPLALNYKGNNYDYLDFEGAQIAAITHSHSLGYMPAAILVHIIHSIIYGEKSLLDAVNEAEKNVCKLFKNDENIFELKRIIDLAVSLAKNNKSDIDNIHQIGEGWVAEETLAIAVYCSLKYQNDFSKGIIAAVNHNGDSDSTGSVTGNILGALHGFDKIERKWKNDLELYDVILEIADDLYHGCRISEYSPYEDKKWETKYIYMKKA